MCYILLCTSYIHSQKIETTPQELLYAQSAIYSQRLTVYLNGESVVKNEVQTVYVLENLINKNYSIGYIKVKLGQKFNVLSFDKKK